MSYKIIVDSCGELPVECKESGLYENVPLSIDIDGYEIIDDEAFDQADFLQRVEASPNCPKSSCPSPERYLQAFEGDADHVYVVTLSAELSGSYNSAELAKKMYEETDSKKKIHIFNSRSASIGETLIALKAEACEKAGMLFEETVKAVEEYITGQNTYFVLESLETLRKNGRLSNLKAFVASALNIKPIMGATPQGTIMQLDQSRGINKALKKMTEIIAKEVKNPAEKILAISHCNCKERAQMVKDELLKRIPVKDVVLLDTRGISSLYANDGGIIVVI